MRKALRQIAFSILLATLTFSWSNAALSGAYTINAGAAASATNYQNFASAFSDMNLGTRSDGGTPNGVGVTGPVVFTVSAGTYTEKVRLTAVTGASATNTITIDGVDPATRTLTSVGVTTNDYTLRLDGADFIRVINLGVGNSGPTYGYGIQLINAANNNIIQGCKVTLPNNTSGVYKVGIIAAPYYTTNALNADNLLIKNNEILGGRFAVVANGPTNTQSVGLVVDSNVVNGAYYAAFYFRYENQLQVTGNQITMTSSYNFSRGMELRNCSRLDISNNKLLQCGTYGIYMISTNFNTNDEARIYNNMIGGSFLTTGTSYGIYMSSCRHTKIVHNSVLMDNPGSGARCLYLTGSNSTGIEILNNSFAATNASLCYAYYIVNQNYVQLVDYNNLYSASPGNLAYISGNYANLAALQAGNITHNQNSQSAWPNYFSSTNLHTFGPPLNNWATNVAWVTSDIDAESRPLAPDLIKDVGADEHVLPPVDMDIWAILSPTVLGLGNNAVTIQLQNNGNNSLNGTPVSLQYSTDGGTTWPVTEIFTPATLAAPGNQENYTFTAPWVVTTAGTYTMCVRINPQVTGDPDASDMVCLQVCTGMNGAYTINPANPTAGNNFNNFTDCATALNGCGVNAPVTIDVSPGTYNETFHLGSILGTSATNTVTINGGNMNQVTLTQTFSSTNNAVVLFDGTDYVTFKNMTITAPGSSGYCIMLKNQADYNTVDSCSMEMPQSTTPYHIGVLFAQNTYSTYGNTGNYNTISNNSISGGYYGMRINGIGSTSYTQGNKILNNEVENFYYYGIYNYYQEDIEIVGNYVHGDQSITNPNSYGIYSYYAHGDFNIAHNRVHTVGRYGMYFGYANRYNTGRGRIDNNMIGADFFSTSQAYGIYFFRPYDIEVINNSISLNGYSGYALYLSTSTSTDDSIRFVNNIFSGGGNYPGQGGQAFYTTVTGTITQMDHNNFWTMGSVLATFGGTYTTLNALQAAQPAFNQNSVNGNPGFISTTDLHIICSPIDDQGFLYPGTTVDFDDQLRNTATPDIGADEFTGISITMDLGQDSTHCDPLYFWGDTTNYVGFQWGAGQTSPSLYIDSTDVYFLTVTDSNNCSASDSVLVTVLDLPSKPWSNDTIGQCRYDTIDAGNPGSTYLWNTSDTTQLLFPGNSTTYIVDITSSDGCITTDSITINLFADAVANLGPDSTFCLGVGYLLDAGTGPTGTGYIWSSGSTTQQVLVTAPGLYTVTVNTPQGCSASDSVFMNALLAPVVNLGPDRTECDNWVLDAGNGGVMYSWSTGATTQTINGAAAGTYTVTVTNGDGCPTTDQVIIGMGSTPTVNLGTPATLCQGQTVTLNSGNPGFNYLWSNGATSQSVMVSSAGTYIVDVTDPNSGCVGSDTVNVAQSFLSVNLGPDFVLCDGSNAVLDAGTGATGFLWNGGATTQTLTVTTAGTYSVQVSDNLGCIVSDNVIITTGTLPSVSYTAVNTAMLWQNIQFNDASGANVTSWSWDFGDGTTSSQQNPAHAFVALGTFNVCLTASDGDCDDTFCTTVTITNPVDIEDDIFNEGVTVFPNPSNGEFAIDFDLPKFMDVTVDIVSLTGQRVLHREISGVRFHREAMDLSQHAAGMYFLRIVSNKGNEMIRKIIIE